MVDHKSTGLPECGPTESSAPEPCFFSNPNGIERHIIIKVKVLLIGDIINYLNEVQSDFRNIC